MIGWNPQPDISLHELAVALGLLVHMVSYTPQQQLMLLESLPENVQRHFVVVGTGSNQ